MNRKVLYIHSLFGVFYSQDVSQVLKAAPFAVSIYHLTLREEQKLCMFFCICFLAD